MLVSEKKEGKYLGSFFYLPETNADWSLSGEQIVSKDVEAVDVTTLTSHCPDL